MKFKNKLIKEIIDKYYFIDSIERLGSLAHWDLNTYMPIKAAEERGFILGKAEILVKKLLLSKDFILLLNKSQKENILNDFEKGIVRILKKRIEILSKIPDQFIEELNNLTNKAQVVWREAKKENNFKIFKPYLEKIVALIRKETDYLGYKKHPYDALIDLYEEGWTTEDFSNFFESIKPRLKSIFDEIRKSEKYISKSALEKEKYTKEQMEKLNLEVLKILNFDSQRSRIDIAPHPFETSLSLNDVRITTWYQLKDFRRSLTATIHEYGHALYELQIDPEIKFTPLQGGVSYGIHESQSRFWEIIVGKNINFLKLIFPLAKKHLEFLKKYKEKDFIYYFNLIRPEFIRVESDEITYHFHIILRFEIEKGLLEGKIKVKELPEIWREKMKSYLGICPQNDQEGILQDIHWSCGYFGYFPTYSLGTFLAGMWLEKIEEDLGTFDKILREESSIIIIQNWLKKNIHRYGKTYTSKELIKKVYKKEFSPEPFLKFLENKLLNLYS